MKPHKHAELIKAWANGATIESRNIYGSDTVWRVTTNPSWHHEVYEYRIKPEPKTDDVAYACFKFCKQANDWRYFSMEKHNLKLIFDGETGELKSAEVLI